MAMRSILPLLVGSESAAVVQNGRGLSQTAIGRNGEHGDRAPSVVRHQSILSRLIEGYVAGIGSLGRDLVQQR